MKSVGDMSKNETTRRQFLLKISAGIGASCLAPFLSALQLSRLTKPAQVSHTANMLPSFLHPQSLVLEKDEMTGKAITSSMGFAATVTVDKENLVVIKRYAVDGKCVGGAPPIHSLNNHERMKEMYFNDKRHLQKLITSGSQYIHSDIVFDDERFEIRTPFVGHDLLFEINQNGFKLSNKHKKQIVEMVKEYRELGFYKQNIAASNLVYARDNDRIIAIDFKWAEPATERSLSFELQSNVRWLSELDPYLPREIAEAMPLKTGDREKTWVIEEHEFFTQEFENGLSLWKGRDSRMNRGLVKDERVQEIQKSLIATPYV